MSVYISNRKMLPTLPASRKEKPSPCSTIAQSIRDDSSPTNEKLLTLDSRLPPMDFLVIQPISVSPFSLWKPSSLPCCLGLPLACHHSHVPHCHSSFSSQINLLLLVKELVIILFKLTFLVSEVRCKGGKPWEIYPPELSEVLTPNSCVHCFHWVASCFQFGESSLRFRVLLFLHFELSEFILDLDRLCPIRGKISSIPV